MELLSFNQRCEKMEMAARTERGKRKEKKLSEEMI
jgi:hypothetical protein